MRKFAAVIGAFALITTVAAAWTSMASAAFPGRNGLIVFSSWGAIYTLDPSTHKVTLISGKYNTWPQETEPSWSPNGKQIAFLHSGGQGYNDTGGMDVWVMNANGRGAHALTHVNKRIESPTWLAGGNEIGYLTADNEHEIVIDVHGRKVEQVNTGGASRAFWSSTRHDFVELLCSPASGCPDTPLVVPPPASNVSSNTWAALSGSDFLSWSPDGAMFAGSELSAIAVVGSTGGNLRRVAVCPSVSYTCGVDGIAWSPDGNEIAFAYPGPGGNSSVIAVAHANGAPGLVFHLTIKGASINGLDWQPR